MDCETPSEVASDTDALQIGPDRRLKLILMICALALVPWANAAREKPDPGEKVARNYVELVLALGQHDSDYVDAYYGPPEWKTRAASAKKTLETIGSEAKQLRAVLPGAMPSRDEMDQLRREYLDRQLSALETRVRMLSGEKLKFDEESRALYDAVAPTLPESHFQEILEKLEPRIPGTGPLHERYEKWRKAFVIPADKLDAVFQAALKEARARTLAAIQLPAEESFKIEYVKNRPWGAYNWYQGNYRSIIQVNTDLPVYIDRAFDLAAHEGYPGHHVYNALLEKHLVRDRGWTEFCVYPLFSPQSLVAEGTANFGREVVLSGPERLAFEKEVLFPAAGLDPAHADEYYAVQAMTKQLAFAVNEAARKYLDGEMKAAKAAAFLEKYGLLSPERARQRVRFIDQYRTYVINYNFGEEMVREYIERRGGTSDQPEKRWKEFEQLLASPRLPSGLQ